VEVSKAYKSIVLFFPYQSFHDKKLGEHHAYNPLDQSSNVLHSVPKFVALVSVCARAIACALTRAMPVFTPASISPSSFLKDGSNFLPVKNPANQLNMQIKL